MILFIKFSFKINSFETHLTVTFILYKIINLSYSLYKKYRTKSLHFFADEQRESAITIR